MSIYSADTKAPPSDTGAEKAVLGSIIIAPDKVGAVAGIVQPIDFYDEAHRVVFEHVVGLHAAGTPIDATTITSSLKQAKACDVSALEHVGGIGYIATLVNSVPTAHNVEAYAITVADCATLRRIHDLGLQMVHAVDHWNGADVSEYLGDRRSDIDVLISRSNERRESDFAPTPITEISECEKVEWIWHGWLARGSITEMVGLWKSGKTTLVGHVLHAATEGGNIAGRIEPHNVLVVSEETTGLWLRRRDELGVGENVHLLCRPFKGKPSQSQWVKFVGSTANYVDEHNIDLVVLDPWQSLNPMQNENDSSETMTAATPLHQITAAGNGCAILLLHHPRKGDGTEGQAARGSGALAGFVDVIMELRRFSTKDTNDTRRTLTGLSRYDETPKQCVIELTDGGYVTLGDVSQANRADRCKVITDILSCGDYISLDGILESWPNDVTKPGNRTLRDDLKKGSENGLWDRTGNGTRGDPHLFGIDSGKP